MRHSISVPSPCSENWNGMPQQGNGRYCGSCQKVVVDFTNKTNEEILEYIRENSEKKSVCGTFKNSQLRPHVPDRTIRFLAALLLVFGMSLFSCQSIDLGDKPPAVETPEIMGDFTLAPPPLDTLPELHSTMGVCIPNSFDPPIIADEEIITTSGIPTIDPVVDEPIVIPETIDLSPEQQEEMVFGIVEQMPEFPGGEAAMMKFIRDNLHFPEAEDLPYTGTIYLSFVVKKDGSIDDIKVLRSLVKAYDDEAIRVVKLMPKWIPGKNAGKEVNVQVNLPFRVHLR